MQVPHVSRQEFTLLDVNEDDFVRLLLILTKCCKKVLGEREDKLRLLGKGANVVCGTGVPDGRERQHQG